MSVFAVNGAYCCLFFLPFKTNDNYLSKASFLYLKHFSIYLETQANKFDEQIDISAYADFFFADKMWTPLCRATFSQVDIDLALSKLYI